jgi:putative radical SAM enzyme (TIGR03279 family)
MTLYQEIDWTAEMGGEIAGIFPNSLAEAIGLQIGDHVLAINETRLEDVIDVQYYSAEEEFELLIRRGDEYIAIEVERDYDEELGIEFSHPTFDTDIRRCNNLCEFCFVLQMAPKFRRTLYIKDDDYRYSFLFGHFVTLTNLTEHDWWRIENMGLSPLYVSVHVTDLQKRRDFLRNKTAPEILGQLRWLADRNIQVNTQLVIVPDFNDGEWMRQSVADLEAMHPHVQSISVVPVGLTKQHKYTMRPHTKEEAMETLDYIEALQPQYLERFGERFVYPTDEWFLVAGRQVPESDYYDNQVLQENGLGMVRGFLDEWAGVQEEIEEWLEENEALFTATNITLLTGTLFAGTLQTAVTELNALLPLHADLITATNIRFGDTITVAGLLMGNDVLAQLQEHGYGDLVILPRIMFDHPDTITLDDISPQDVANQLGVPIALADSMGDVWDALIGESQVVYMPAKPTNEPILLKIIDPPATPAHIS